MPTPTLPEKIGTAVDIVEQVLGSPLASMVLSMAMKKFAGELTDADRQSLDQNYAEGLAARADAFERAHRTP